jgi:hypothetical protein
MNVRFVSLMAALAMTTVGAWAHGPDPTFSGPLWEQDIWKKYAWKSGQVPPSWMKPAINAAAADNNDTMKARGAKFGYSSSATPKVRYGEPSGCGVNGIACMSRTVPSTYKVAFRKHGYVFDWGTLKWCQKYDAPPNGCFDVRNIMLDELGHVQILAHHVNYSNNSDYAHAIVQTVSRTKGHSGYNTHHYQKCDVATLQKKYDVPSWTTKYSTCLNLDTSLSLSAESGGGDVTFTASLKVKDVSSYGRLKKNPIAGRTVRLEKKAAGASSWSFVGNMSAVEGNVYQRSLALPMTSTQYRARFVTPDDEGINGSTSGALTLVGQ